jgi:RNA polymerase sigma-70 factor (ECF subfamily)
VESLEEFVCGSEGSQDAERLHDAAATADEAAMDHERRRLLARALDSLDDEARELLVLRYFEKMPARGIAETVGSTEGAVRTRIHRILKGLRTEYGPERDNW